jgi:invasion protein IalB
MSKDTHDIDNSLKCQFKTSEKICQLTQAVKNEVYEERNKSLKLEKDLSDMDE